MKKVLSVLAALTVVGSASCFGAAAVSLNNYDANTPVFYQTEGNKAGAGCYIAIFSGADAVASTSGGATIFSLADDPGFFDGGIGNVPGLADNAPATFTAIAWKGDGTAAGMAAALEKGTVTWTQNTGANSPPNLPSPAVLNLPSLLIPIPEPTTIALGLIGAAGLLFFRRK
jgi:hypothetical protein